MKLKKKRILSFLLCAIMTITSIPTLPVYAADVVQIGSAADLKSTLEVGKTYELTADITLESDQQIDTIAGVLDGKGHTITLNGKSLANEVSGTIQNLGVKGNVSVPSVDGSMATTLSGTIQNCYSMVAINYTVESGFDDIGGLVGTIADGKIYNSYFAGSNNAMMAEGLVGEVKSGTTSNVLNNNCYTIGFGVCGMRYGTLSESDNKSKSTSEMKTSATLDILNNDLPDTGYKWALPTNGSNDGYPVLVVDDGSVDKSSLDAAITKAEGLEEGSYTEDTWQTLKTALANAKVMTEKEDAKQKEINEACKVLEAAIEGLKKIRPTEAVAKPSDEEKIEHIKTQSDLEAIGSGASDKYYILDNDITLANYYMSFDTFNGVFDGNGHTITFSSVLSGLFANIGENGIVQNTKFSGALPYDVGACGVEVQGAIINCYTEVSGDNAYGFAKRLNDGVISNCYSLSTAKLGAIIGKNSSVSRTVYTGTLKNVYWKQGLYQPVDLETLTCQGTVTAVSATVLRSSDFVDTMNANKGENGTSWGMSEDGYPYFGEDQEYIPAEDRLEANKTAIAFTPNGGIATAITDQKLTIDRNLANEYKIAGVFSLPEYQIPEGAHVAWSVTSEDGDIMLISEDDGELFVCGDGIAVVKAVLVKADSDTEHLASVKVTTFTEEIEAIELWIADDDGKNAVKINNNAAEVNGSEYKKVVIKAKYKNGSIYQTISNQDFTFTMDDPDGVVKHMDNSSVFRFTKPGTATMKVAHKNGLKASVALTSKYVAVTSVKPAHEGTFVLHGRNANSSGGASFNPIYSSVIVMPANASYANNFTITSSDDSVGEYIDSMVKGYVPYKAGTVTYTASVTDNGKTVKGTSKVNYEYQNPLKRVSVENDMLTVKKGEKISAGLIFEGTKDGEGYEVTEAGMVWTFDKEGIVSISRNGGAFKRDESAPDNNCYFLSEEYVIKGLKEGTVKVTGTPVDTTAGAKAVTFTVTVGENSDLKEADIWTNISDGIANASNYLIADLANSPVGAVYGHEWHIITLLRAGKTIDQNLLDSYYEAVVKEIKTWDGSEKPTDIERVALALTVMGKDITDVEGVNLAEMIYNSTRLADGSNELAYALLALDAKGTEIPASAKLSREIQIPTSAKWSRETIIEELLKFQNGENGGFGLTDNETTSVDMTAMCLQALAPYKEKTEVAKAIEKGLDYLRANITADYDYSDSCATAQVLLALATLKIDVTDEANGFGDVYENIITRLEEYKTDNGYRWMLDSDSSKTPATYQVMQALDAYRKAMKEGISYWDFDAVGEEYEDRDGEQTPTDPGASGEPADPIQVYVTISNAGNVTVMQKAVEVTDRNKDGYLDVDEVLYATHEKFYTGGAEEGYATASTAYGLSITKLWGDTSRAFGYWKNNVSCWSLGDAVEEGDYVTAFVYQDKTYYSDAYSYFDSNTYKTVAGEALSVLLKKADGYDEYWNTLFANYEGASIRVYKDGKVVDADTYTIKNKGDGIYAITFAEEGTYYLVANSETDILVPAVCEIVCTAKEGGDKKDEAVKNDSAVNTGDNAPFMMLVVLMAAAAITMVVVEKKKYKTK